MIEHSDKEDDMRGKEGNEKGMWDKNVIDRRSPLSLIEKLPMENLILVRVALSKYASNTCIPIEM